jgi:hypothetical protein
MNGKNALNECFVFLIDSLFFHKLQHIFFCIRVDRVGWYKGRLIKKSIQSDSNDSKIFGNDLFTSLFANCNQCFIFWKAKNSWLLDQRKRISIYADKTSLKVVLNPRLRLKHHIRGNLPENLPSPVPDYSFVLCV